MVPSDKQRYTILVADDSEMNRSILRSMLEESYDIIEAEDGLQAVALLQQIADRVFSGRSIRIGDGANLVIKPGVSFHEE